jgi:4-hydroxybenzoate polyprenyltransferase
MGALRPWLQLVRLPAVFTAVADVLCGWLLANAALVPNTDRLPKFSLPLLLLASCGLYLAGMVFNDVCDARVDAVERPQRPIPSGRVSRRGAVLLGVVLMGGGIAAAAGVSAASLKIALLLAGAILLYDAVLKRLWDWHLGLLPMLGMGSCRLLNVMLGASTLVPPFLWSKPQLLVAGALGIYVAGITWFARHEAEQSRRWSLIGAAALVNLGLAAMLALILGYTWRSGADRGYPLFAFAAILVTIDRRLLRAIRSLAPRDVQAAVRIMLLSIVTLDAVFVLAQSGDRWLAGGVALLVVPALLVGRWLYVT